jgi:hypothetical protein
MSIDRAFRGIATTTAAAAALLGPLAAEAARRRGRRNLRDYHAEAGSGGRATANADGGEIIIGGDAIPAIGSYSTRAGQASASASDDEDAVGSERKNRNNNNDRDDERRNRRDDDDDDDNPVGGRAGEAAERLRERAARLTGADGRDNDRGGNDPGETDMNISSDPETGAFAFDNGNIAFIRDDDGSFFVQTGNITFESGPGTRSGGNGGGNGGGGNGGGDNNEPDFAS